MKYWEIIADNLSKAGLELGLCLSRGFQRANDVEKYNSDGGAYVRLTSYWLHGYRALPYILIQTDSESGGDISPEKLPPPTPDRCEGRLFPQNNRGKLRGY
jgi:hypothetical protein